MDGLHDQRFNIRLVKTIKKYPTLYNTDLKVYKRRDCREQAWIEVGEEMNCDPKILLRKWQNFRTILVRKLKQKQMGEPVPPYYLYEHMKFVIPYLKKSYEPNAIERTIKKNISEEDEEAEEQYEADSNQSTEDNNTISENDIDDPIYFDDEETDIKSSKKIKMSNSIDEQPEAIGIDEYIDAINHESETKLQKSVLVKTESTSISRPSTSTKVTKVRTQPDLLEYSDNPKRQFVLSLLPDLYDMNNSQMREFKCKVLALINEILDEKII